AAAAAVRATETEGRRPARGADRRSACRRRLQAERDEDPWPARAVLLEGGASGALSAGGTDARGRQRRIARRTAKADAVFRFAPRLVRDLDRQTPAGGGSSLSSAPD